MDQEDSRVQRLAVLDALVRAGEHLPRLIALVAQNPADVAVERIADLLQCGEAEARAVYSAPLRWFSPESRARIELESTELRAAIG